MNQTRKILLIGGAIVFGVMSLMAAGDHNHKNAEKDKATISKEKTLKGEVVDIFCYLSHPEHGLGKTHMKCAEKCIKGGLPAGIKVGDQLYLATMTGHASANKILAPYAGKNVTVTGRVMERDGQKLVAIKSIDEVK